MRKVGNMPVIGASDIEAREMKPKDIYHELLRFLVYPTIMLYRIIKHNEQFPLIPYRLIFIKKALDWIDEYERMTMGKITKLSDFKLVMGE